MVKAKPDKSVEPAPPDKDAIRERLRQRKQLLADRMKNPNLRTKHLNAYKWTKPGLPTRENCDLDDPKEMFLWMLVALPGVNGAPIIPSVELLMMWSEHFYECGARLGAEPEKKYRAPAGNDPNLLTSPGRWVRADEPDPPRRVATDVWRGLQGQQQAQLVQAIFSDNTFWGRLPKDLKAQLREALSDPT